MLKYMYIACRVWIVAVYFAGFSSYWTTAWMPWVGLVVAPLSTVAFTFAKFAAISEDHVCAVVVFAIVVDVFAAICFAEQDDDGDEPDADDVEELLEDLDE